LEFEEASMPSKKTLMGAILIVASGFLSAAAPTFAANKYELLHRFDERHGAYPYGGLIFDAAGNLYGTTFYGGNYDRGTVFRLTRGTNGKWTRKVLHHFGGGNDGIEPMASLIFDTAGNLYGTTYSGGVFGRYEYGGTVFELTPHTGDKWTEKVLHNFGVNNDGAQPSGSLVFDNAGNLYGTTTAGGNFVPCNLGCGTIFELTPGSNGKWTERILHRFNFNNGANPSSNLIFDASGNLYGTTTFGGPGKCSNSSDQLVGCGTVFMLTPSHNGRWVQSVLYDFMDYYGDGAYPSTGVILDAEGNLYGTAAGGPEWGTVFEVMPGHDGQWTEKQLYSFDETDGAQPLGMIFDSQGNLYGMTNSGGGSDRGTVFELMANGGTWTETVLYNFCPVGGCADGEDPLDSVIMDTSGNLYGTTSEGGLYGYGVIFELEGDPAAQLRP
jgi:uncharacterized repeat protein (TIGR03803 family)